MIQKIKRLFIGAAKDPTDRKVFHSLSLVPFLAWVGLGSDGLSSSCYGPEEAFRALGGHPYLSIFVAIASGITILIISQSYKQIINLFPAGGGGYLVASRLLGPKTGMVSGCALLIDYVLTISISIASGAAAIFSFLPQSLQGYRLEFAIGGLVILTIVNLRGIKEAVLPLVPVFLLFVFLHVFAILYAIITHALQMGVVYNKAVTEFAITYNELGSFGAIFLILKAFSMGAGTYTGIEAVSNGLPILRDPKVHTAQKTMNYMAISLAITVVGLMIAYLLFGVQPQEGKTLNAILYENMTAQWGSSASQIFIYMTLISEAILLFIAAQTGFLDGPRVLSSMAIDRWFPSRFANLSDRLVTKNGIILMAVTSLLMLVVSNGSVTFLVVLYSINVFITFTLSQLGMVKHWWQERKTEKTWKGKIAINGVGLTITAFILISVIVIKFEEGGWVTIFVTGFLVFVALFIKRHYHQAHQMLNRLESLVDSVEASVYKIENTDAPDGITEPQFQQNAKTAIILVNGYNGLGLHTLLSSIQLFSGIFKNYIFLQVGAVDAGNFKGADEISSLERHIRAETEKYVQFMKRNGYYAEAVTSISTDVIEELGRMGPELQRKYHNVVFFGGQLVFPEETFLTKWLHNYVVFATQRKFYYQGIPFVILPIRI